MSQRDGKMWERLQGGILVSDVAPENDLSVEWPGRSHVFSQAWSGGLRLLRGKSMRPAGVLGPETAERVARGMGGGLGSNPGLSWGVKVEPTDCGERALAVA